MKNLSAGAEVKGVVPIKAAVRTAITVHCAPHSLYTEYFDEFFHQMLVPLKLNQRGLQTEEGAHHFFNVAISHLNCSTRLQIC